MNSNDKLAEAVTAALNARVAEGEDVRFYVESSMQSDEELVRELVAEEVMRSAILAADAILNPPVEGEWVPDMDFLRDCVIVARQRMTITTRDYERCTELLEAIEQRIRPTPPADKQDGIVVPASLVCEIYQNLSDMPINDDWALRIERKLQPLIAATPMPVFRSGEVAKDAAPAPSEADGGAAWNNESARKFAERVVSQVEIIGTLKDQGQEVLAVVMAYARLCVRSALLSARNATARPQTGPAPVVGGVDQRFTELLLSVINDVQNELGFSDEDKECSNGSAEIVDAIRELKAGVRNAERYQWLRSLDGSCDAAACVNFNLGFDWQEAHGVELDAAIDAAITAQAAQEPTHD